MSKMKDKFMEKLKNLVVPIEDIIRNFRFFLSFLFTSYSKIKFNLVLTSLGTQFSK